MSLNLRDSKTKGINTGNTKYSFTTATAWRLAQTFLEVFHLHRSLTTLSINGIVYETRFSGRVFVNIHFTKCTFVLHNCCIYILVDIALFLIGFAACSLICLAITLCTDLTKCVGLSLIKHQHEKLTIF